MASRLRLERWNPRFEMTHRHLVPMVSAEEALHAVTLGSTCAR
jgi:hypothetical protein